MEYLGSILWLISLPIVIFFTYHAIIWAIKKMEKNG